MNPFRNRRWVNASPASVYRACEDPDLLARWWGPAGFTCEFETFEFRVGGRWKFTMKGPDGASFPQENRFDDLVPGRRVVVRHTGQPLFTATLTFEAAAGGTEVTWEQAFDDDAVAASVAAVVEPANVQVLDKLQAVAEAL